MSRPHWRPAYVGVGSNLDGPMERVLAGIDAIDQITGSRVLLRSACYQSAPLSGDDQPDYVNAVAGILTRLSPEALLDELLTIERDHGRNRAGGKWSPRTLDLDMLAMSDRVIQTRSLTLPHPGIADRVFVLLPWAEIAPHVRVPGLGTVVQLAQRLKSTLPIRRLR